MRAPGDQDNLEENATSMAYRGSRSIGREDSFSTDGKSRRWPPSGCPLVAHRWQICECAKFWGNPEVVVIVVVEAASLIQLGPKYGTGESRPQIELLAG